MKIAHIFRFAFLMPPFVLLHLVLQTLGKQNYDQILSLPSSVPKIINNQ